MLRYTGSPIARASQVVSPGALTVMPAAGSNANIVLSGGVLNVTGGDIYLTPVANYGLRVSNGAGVVRNLISSDSDSILRIGHDTTYFNEIRFSTLSGPDEITLKNGNVGIGTTVFGTSAAKVLAMANDATEPTTSTDLVHIYGLDLSAGNAALAVYAEAPLITTVDAVAIRKVPFRYNGVTIYLLATTSAA